jgi:hypothetical protein
MCWNDRAEINAFLKNHDYALLAYDEAADRFSPNGLQPATQWAQRNFFGVPNEKRGLLNGVMQAG